MFEIVARSGADQVADLSARDVLRLARSEQAAARRAEAGLLVAALQWAVIHPSSDGTPSADDAAVFIDAAGAEPIAGEGCPGVAEFAVAEFGTELGLSTTQAKRLIGHALEMAHRLPRLWGRVLAGEVDPWRARRVAETTIHAFPRLTREAAAWVDAQVAPFLGRVGPAQVERLVAQAVTRFDLAEPDEASDELVNRLHVTLSSDDLAFAGTLDVTATLTIADGLDLDAALRAGAQELKALGSSEPLGARRSRALGQMARTQTALDLFAADQGDDATMSVPVARAKAARRVDLHLHFAASAIGGGVDVASDGRLENGQRLVLLEHVKQWCRDTFTEVRVLPVLDLAAELSSTGYVPSPLLKRQVQVRDHTCLFPWCSRSARASDLDHVVPYDVSLPPDPDPQTRSSNLAALCRTHHRLKTHTGWRMEMPTPGVVEWRSPHGHRYRRDASGSVRLEPDPLLAPA